MRRHLCREKRAPQHARPLPNTASKTLRREIKEINSLVVPLPSVVTQQPRAISRFRFTNYLVDTCLRHPTDILRFRLPRKNREIDERPFVLDSENFLGNFCIAGCNSKNSNIIVSYESFVFSYRLNYYYRTFPLIRLDNNRDEGCLDRR